MVDEHGEYVSSRDPSKIRFQFFNEDGTLYGFSAYVNDFWHEEGNWRRSLPIKCGRSNYEKPLDFSCPALLLQTGKLMANLVR